MKTIVETPPAGSVLLHGISWTTYEKLLAEIEKSHQHLRLTYDEGELEIMVPSTEHERFKARIGRLIEAMTCELEIPITSGGSTTFKSKLLKKGLEPDECYWVAHARAVWKLTDFVFGRDPAPDLAIEVEVTETAVRRLGIYASLGIPEVWRWRKGKLVFLELADGEYDEIGKSRAFPFLTPEPIVRFIAEANKAPDETAWIRKFTAWVRAEFGGKK